MTRFKDHFSGHAADYRAHRPGYPDNLFDWLAGQITQPRHAWDCATGNGQAAVSLAQRFDHVTATDASRAQIAQTEPVDSIDYQVASAEHSGLADASVDLITVAQAAHWFDMAAFNAEVTRVLRPGGVLALWCYGLARITPEVDAVVDHFYHHSLGPYWPAERRHVENGYRDLVMPFTPIAAPAFDMQADWSMDELLGYLASWSASRRHLADTGEDGVAHLAPALRDAWGKAQRRSVTWPLHIRCTRRER